MILSVPYPKLMFVFFFNKNNWKKCNCRAFDSSLPVKLLAGTV